MQLGLYYKLTAITVITKVSPKVVYKHMSNWNGQFQCFWRSIMAIYLKLPENNKHFLVTSYNENQGIH